MELRSQVTEVMAVVRLMMMQEISVSVPVLTSAFFGVTPDGRGICEVMARFVLVKMSVVMSQEKLKD